MKKKCWAHSYGNCEGKLSREHIISEGILKKIPELLVFGFPWCKDKKIRVAPKALASKILCEKHNSDLSKYDQELINLWEILVENSKRRVINGKKIERCFLKYLINTAIMQKKDKSFDHLIPFVFGEQNFSFSPVGLNFFLPENHKIQGGGKYFYALPFFNKNKLIGGLFEFDNWQWFLNLNFENPNTKFSVEKHPELSHWAKSNPIWHPPCLEVRSSTFNATIKFVWE